jgi:hypothetical protein
VELVTGGAIAVWRLPHGRQPDRTRAGVGRRPVTLVRDYRNGRPS